jgi:hypothetical protein
MMTKSDLDNLFSETFSSIFTGAELHLLAFTYKNSNDVGTSMSLSFLLIPGLDALVFVAH